MGFSLVCANLYGYAFPRGAWERGSARSHKEQTRSHKEQTRSHALRGSASATQALTKINIPTQSMGTSNHFEILNQNNHIENNKEIKGETICIK